ncbi:TetR/AcrR family transcriptional regulator [Sphingomicrobium sp. XHP0239]|uniref:TetR/AcrR family transcriptional regulator n=1 Tax=Sphingomicrobium maritimum TaxID=3133972 RepID=UPI0031CC6A36
MSGVAAHTSFTKPRDRALAVASQLFYAHGVRAVGMDMIVERSGIAKTTIYRHFPTKDDLIAAFLEREDAEFWTQWDAVVDEVAGPRSNLDALCEWIAQRVARDGYRGCPQINVAAEFADAGHPARIVARKHKKMMHERLTGVCKRLGLDDPNTVALQIGLVLDGAFSSDGRLARVDGETILRSAVRKLVAN